MVIHGIGDFPFSSDLVMKKTEEDPKARGIFALPRTPVYRNAGGEI